jgi:hypothetical protein
VKSVLIDSDILIEVSQGRDAGILTKWDDLGRSTDQKTAVSRMGAHRRLKLGTSIKRSRRGFVVGETRCISLFAGPAFHGRITEDGEACP